MTDSAPESRPGWVTVEVPGSVAALGDAGVRACVVFAATVVAGFVGLGLAWRNVAREAGVWVQVPFLVSAAFGGLALIGTGAVLFAVQLERRRAATRRTQLEDVISSTARVVDLLAARQLRLPVRNR